MFIHKGFTLIELMITILVMAIVLMLAVPSFTTMIVNNRSIALGEDLASALNFARSEAVKRGRIVSICASNDGATCAGNWTDGYIAFVDSAASETAAEPVEGTILRVWDRPAQGAAISAQRDGSDIDFIRFTGMGTLARIDDHSVQLDAEVDKCTGDAGRRITIGLSGMVGIAKNDCP